MTVNDLFSGVIEMGDDCLLHGQEIVSIVTDSRRVDKNSLFICLAEKLQDAQRFIRDAIDQGAQGVIVRQGFDVHYGQAWVVTHPDPKKILPILLNRFHDNPSQKISLIGVTGTNGKTTTAYLVESIYRHAGKQCGVIGTVNYRFADQVFEAKNTTPGLVDNFAYMAQMVAAGMDACVIEVSSHALVQGRVDGLTFREAIFSNLTSDHLDYHKTRDEYFLAKAKFFDGTVDIQTAVVNTDDEYGRRLIAMTTAPVITYAIDQTADICARDISLALDGSRFTMTTPSGLVEITTPLIGRHNVYNILAAASACMAEGFSLDQIQRGVSLLQGVPGRLERIEGAKGFFVFVDYAHTEDALKNVLESIRGTGPARILVVFGCGGDRDKTKRPKMAAVVEQWADFAVVTNDNPRTEDAQSIIEDIQKGFRKDRYTVMFDRAEAIQHVLRLVRPGDCVLIAGKGHEDYQIFHDRTIHFDDREVARSFLKG